LFLKCAKTHLRASAVLKKFSSQYPQTPVKEGEEGLEREGVRGSGEDGMEIREERNEYWRV
jgi:hypothetical protein